MQSCLFTSHLDLAHSYWRRLLRPGDWAVDATCGNGKDTLELAKLVLANDADGGVVSLDIQASALTNGRQRISAMLSPEQAKKVLFLHHSHIDFPREITARPIRLFVYNLGYLPGGDRSLHTLCTTTLLSVTKAIDLVTLGGVISITCYPGHEEGAREQTALLDWALELSPSRYQVCHHTFPNRKASPSLLLIQKCHLSQPGSAF